MSGAADAEGVLIRGFRAADEADWRRLWSAYLAFYESSVEEPVYRSTWARLLSEDPAEINGFIARAVDGDGAEGAALGLTHYLHHRHCWRIENVCYLQDLYVDETVRGGGVGRRLMEAVYAAADAAGAGEVYWSTQHFNARARALYDRIGEQTPFIKYRHRLGR